LKRIDKVTSCEDYIESDHGDVETGKRYKPRMKEGNNQIALQFEKGGGA
jgi:hypothetical protein